MTFEDKQRISIISSPAIVFSGFLFYALAIFMDFTARPTPRFTTHIRLAIFYWNKNFLHYISCSRFFTCVQNDIRRQTENFDNFESCNRIFRIFILCIGNFHGFYGKTHPLVSQRAFVLPFSIGISLSGSQKKQHPPTKADAAQAMIYDHVSKPHSPGFEKGYYLGL